MNSSQKTEHPCFLIRRLQLMFPRLGWAAQQKTAHNGVYFQPWIYSSSYIHLLPIAFQKWVQKCRDGFHFFWIDPIIISVKWQHLWCIWFNLLPATSESIKCRKAAILSQITIKDQTCWTWKPQLREPHKAKRAGIEMSQRGGEES